MLLLERSSEFKYIAVDTEGYSYRPLGISIANPLGECAYFPIGHTEDVNIDEELYKQLIETIKKIPYRIMHNAGHDIVILPELHDLNFVCTMIMAHMVDENVMSKALDYLHKIYCGGDGKTGDPIMQGIIDTMGWYAVPYMLMYKYAANDAKITMELFLELLPRYEKEFGPLWSV